jgi:potassium uptake TrkH family protein
MLLKKLLSKTKSKKAVITQYKVIRLKLFFFLGDALRVLTAIASSLRLIAAFAVVCMSVYDIGFQHLGGFYNFRAEVWGIMLPILLFSSIVLLMHDFKDKRRFHLSFLQYSLLSVFLLFVLLLRYPPFPDSAFWRWLGFIDTPLVYYVVFHAVFWVDVSGKVQRLLTKKINPAALLTTGFVFVILAGSGMLMLPKATVNGIHPIDAIFTSTSAVCVTGLIVVDTASTFTGLGRAVILILIQIGGLGIMTFTSFFAIFFREGASFGSQTVMKDFVNEDQMSRIIKTISKILLFTFTIEAIGAVLIYWSVRELYPDNLSLIWFSVFHSISAFCNAGFSTLPNGLADTGVKFNYFLHNGVAGLIILGGLGFPLLLNIYEYSKHKYRNLLRFLGGQRSINRPKVVNVNSRLVFYTTMALLVTGTIVLFFAGYNGAFKDITDGGKLSHAFFLAVTSRTAGFNTFNLESLSLPMVMFVMLLMWIGASPGSTGGGIKTSTFAVALMNVLSMIKGRDNVQFSGREISQYSISKAFSIVLLSLALIFTASILILFFEPDLKAVAVLFETVSAFSTTGLSLGITQDLSIGSKIVLIVCMLVGRVGILTFFKSFVEQGKQSSHLYRLTHENILIT